MKIAIYGLGYIGFTAACCLAKEGNDIVGVDISAEKVRGINQGIPPIAEPHVKDMLMEALENNRLQAVTSLTDFSDIDLAIVCVGTPSATDGSHNMSFIAEVTRQIAEHLTSDNPRLTVAYRSTCRPGTMHSLVSSIFRSALGDGFESTVELVYNPEFLRASSAVHDYFNPPKIVIGTRDGECSACMDALYAGYEAPIFYTRFEEAEITKFIDNSWHAVKVAYANEVGRVCAKLGLSAKKIHEIFVSDTKLNISAYYTRPGGPFGGSCLPKDVRALQFISREAGAATHLIDSIITSNESHKTFQMDAITSAAPFGSKILVVGLAFKANTDDLRESPNVDVARRLLDKGYHLSIYDSSLKADHLRGQNLGYLYTHLPRAGDILVDKATAEEGDWDLVIASNATIDSLSLRASKVIRTYDLD